MRVGKGTHAVASVAACVALLASPVAAGRHVTKLATPATSTAHISFQPAPTIAFPTAQDGWVVDGTLLLHTANAGRVWHPVPQGSGVVESVVFPTPQRGWVLTTQGLYGTVNGGIGWTRLRAAPSSLVEVGLTRQGRGWGITRAGVLWTARNNTTWTKGTLPAPVASACFFNQRVGVAATLEKPGSTVWLTTNGGVTWKIRSPAASLYLQWSGQAPTVQQVQCAGRSTLWMLTDLSGYAGGQTHAVFRSPNLGTHWAEAGWSPKQPGEVFLPGPSGEQLQALGTSRAYLVTTCGACVVDGSAGTTSVDVTTTGGRTWSSVQLPGVGTGLAEIASPTRSWGWVLGTWAVGAGQARVRLFHSVDGGRKWHQMPIDLESRHR